MLPSYQKALSEAKKINGFKELTPSSYQFVTEKDSISAFSFVNTDTSSVFYYQGKVKELTPVNWGSCGFLSNIQEIRKYQLGSKQVVIVNLNCDDLSSKSQKMISENNETFKSINTGITNTPTRWHGLSRDYMLVY